jgi:hypothetical protein
MRKCSVAGNTMARPKTSDTDKLSSRLILRLTDDELKDLQAYSNVCGKSVSEIVRLKITKGRFPSPKSPKLDLQTYTELKKIGVNLNQLTRVVNSGRNVMPMDFYKMIMKMQQHLDLITAKLLYDSHTKNR